MLTVALLMAFVALAGLDTVRARVLTRASMRLDKLHGRARGFGDGREVSMRRGVRAASRCAISTRSGSSSPAAAFMPSSTAVGADLYRASFSCCTRCSVFFALGSAVLLVIMALINEWLVREPLTEADEPRPTIMASPK